MSARLILIAVVTAAVVGVTVVIVGKLFDVENVGAIAGGVAGGVSGGVSAALGARERRRKE